MITKTHIDSLSSTERAQLAQIQSARDTWKEGRAEDALILIESIKDDPASDRVKAECHVASAAFYSACGDFQRSLEAIESAAPVIDAAPRNTRAAFHLQRARIRKRAGDIDAALTDYSGAEILWGELGSDHNQGSAILNVSECYLALGDLEAAQREIDKAFQLFKTSRSFYLSQAHDTQAKIYLVEGKLEQAAQSIKTALETISREDWRATFLATRDQIQARLLEALEVKKLGDVERLRTDMVRRALKESNGSPAGASELLGVTRHAIEWIIDHHPEELEAFRMPRRVRRKPIIKQK